jgi:hypothetical protein
MSKARQQRLKEARVWYPEQHFDEDSHIVKAYRKRFQVDRVCAMRELCMLGMLPAGKQKAYKEQLAARARKMEEKKKARMAAKEFKAMGLEDYQDGNFYFIAGYTSGGAPYGITWEEMGLADEGENEEARETSEDLPF